MTLIFAVCDRIQLLPAFLVYYQRLGIRRFVCGLYDGGKNPLHDQIQLIADRMMADLYIRPSVVCPFEDFNGPKETPGLNLIRQEFVKPGEWFAQADLDEFVFLPGWFTLPEQAALAEVQNAMAVEGILIDRIAQDGTFPEVNEHTVLDDQFPLAAELTRCAGCTTSKIFLAKGNVAIQSGHHRVRDVPVWRPGIEVHHFKWISGIIPIMEERYRNFTRQDLPWREESGRFAKWYKNGIDILDPNIKARFAERIGI